LWPNGCMDQDAT